MSEFDKFKSIGTDCLKDAMNEEQFSSHERMERVHACRANYFHAIRVAGEKKQKAMIFKNLITANKVAAELQEESAMKFYHFDEQIKAINKALFFGQGTMEEAWVENLTDRGPMLYVALKEILAGEEAETKVDQIERLYTKLNKVNVSLAMRLAWAL